jgi:hypothetical protein
MKTKFETQIPIIAMFYSLPHFKNPIEFLNNYDSFENEMMHKKCFFNWSLNFIKSNVPSKYTWGIHQFFTK